MIETYTRAYEMDLTGEEIAEYIFKEIVSDSMSRMNRFERLRAAEKKAEEYMADLRAGIRATSKAEPRAPTSEGRFSIAYTADKTPIAVLDKAIISKPGETKNQAIKRYFAENIRGKVANIVSSGEQAQFDQIKKYLYPGKGVREMDAKREAVAILEDMVSIRTNKRHSADLLVDGKKKRVIGQKALVANSNGLDIQSTCEAHSRL